MKVMVYEHKDLLNRLSEMQRSPYYATACQTLVQAEMAIVNLEIERDELRQKLDGMPTKQPAANFKINGAGTAAVDLTTYWMPITADTPRGVNVQCIARNTQGIAKTDKLKFHEDFYTHWYPVPRFKD